MLHYLAHMTETAHPEDSPVWLIAVSVVVLVLLARWLNTKR